MLERILKIIFPPQVLYQVAKFFQKVFRLKSVGTQIAIWHEGKLLLVRHNYGEYGWSFPGGGLKRGEGPEIGARREAKEEVGLDLMRVNLICERFDGNDHFYLFSAESKGGEIKIDPYEIAEAAWFDPGEIAFDKLTFETGELLSIVIEKQDEHNH